MTRITIRDAARQDISDIWRHTALSWNTDQADTYVAAIDDAIMQLAQNPQSVPPCDWIRPGYRRLKAGSHFVFARMEHGQVVVIRILHKQMNFPDHLDGDAS